MSSKKQQVAVVGGGIVGLATARALQVERRIPVVVLEAADRLATHQTGHNSGVIHSGLYYKPGSLKARNCVEGRAAMVHFCEENGIAAFDVVLADKDLTFDDVFADWLIANYLNDSSLAQGRYGYKELRLRPISLAATHRRLSAQESATVHQYAADYIKLKRGGDMTIKFEGSTTVGVVGAQPHSG